MAKQGLRVLDSDLHLMEPHDMYRRYLAAEYQDRAPLAHRQLPGHFAWWEVSGRRIPPWTENDAVLAANQPLDARSRAVMKDGWDHGFDAASHLRAMDEEGIDVAVLFRTVASMLVSLDDMAPHYSLALCRAFNDWVADYCQEDATRLKATAIVPQQDPGLAAEEARRAVGQLGAVGVVLLPSAIGGRHVNDPSFDALWKVAEELGVPVCFHGTSGAAGRDYLGARLAGQPGYRALSHAAVFSMELMLAMGSMIMGGVLERFPGLTVAFLEGNCSWLPWWLYRLDDQWEKFGSESEGLTKPPSHYFRNQCYISVDPDEYLVADVVARLGDDNLVFSTDYPHSDSAYPHAVDSVLALEGLSLESKRKMLWDNCARLYGID